MNINFNLKILWFNREISITWQWVRFGIIVTALLVSLIVSYWGSFKILLILVALLGGLAGMVVLTQHPNIGFVLTFLSGIFIPFTGPSNINAAVLMVALMLGLWFMDMLVVKRKFEFINSRVLLSVFVFLVVSVVSFGMGQIPWFVFANQAPIASQAGGFAIFVLSAGGLILAAHLIKDLRWLKIIMWSFIGLGAIYIVARLVDFSLIDSFYHIGFTAGSMFWTWLVILSASQAMYNNQLKMRVRVFLAGLVLMTIYVAYVQANDWKSGWVPPLVGIAMLFAIRFKKYIIFAVPFAVLAVVYAAGKLMSSDAYSWGTRVDAWIIVLTISFRVSPLLGMGFSNYYFYTRLFPIRGYSVVFNSHSQYIDLIAEVGLIGLGCFLWIFFETGLLSWSLGNQLKDGFARSYAYGVFAGVIASLMAAFLVDWILPFVYNIGFNGFRASILMWMFFGGLIAVEQMHKKGLIT